MKGTRYVTFLFNVETVQCKIIRQKSQKSKSELLNISSSIIRSSLGSLSAGVSYNDGESLYRDIISIDTLNLTIVDIS